MEEKPPEGKGVLDLQKRNGFKGNYMKLREITPWKINGWFTLQNDLPNLHDYVPC